MANLPRSRLPLQSRLFWWWSAWGSWSGAESCGCSPNWRWPTGTWHGTAFGDPVQCGRGRPRDRLRTAASNTSNATAPASRRPIAGVHQSDHHSRANSTGWGISMALISRGRRPPSLRHCRAAPGRCRPHELYVVRGCRTAHNVTVPASGASLRHLSDVQQVEYVSGFSCARGLRQRVPGAHRRPARAPASPIRLHGCVQKRRPPRQRHPLPRQRYPQWSSERNSGFGS